ncbi:acyl-CoA thioesterase [Oceanococcus atlanticus]|uniref:Acyl-CoA thioesterase n=1 Tax=Oceanococcus atlanticus TaxID=1317117 RepID=A0A1Y1SG74_9GAMM|nr:thioesterase family protein [Oceanococcus atlanticus]ORE88657.1 acyl-CoA thioesterase [Oceanococcus atlanticus]
MTLTQFLNSVATTTEGLKARIPDSWMQGRSTYGGLQAVLAAKAMQPLSDGLPIRTLQATLIAPVEGEVECRAELIRSSKNTRQIRVELIKDEQLHATFMGIFGRPRESVVNMVRARQVSADKSLVWPYMEGISPAFLQNLEVCMLKGNPVGSGQHDCEQLYRLALKDEAPSTELEHVLALADFPPPIGLSWPKGFKPGSTMTWMLNFTSEPVSGHALNDWECEVVLDAASDGYTHQTVSLYAPNGNLLLRGTQCMVVFG